MRLGFLLLRSGRCGVPPAKASREAHWEQEARPTGLLTVRPGKSIVGVHLPWATSQLARTEDTAGRTHLGAVITTRTCGQTQDTILDVQICLSFKAGSSITYSRKLSLTSPTRISLTELSFYFLPFSIN